MSGNVATAKVAPAERHIPRNPSEAVQKRRPFGIGVGRAQIRKYSVYVRRTSRASSKELFSLRNL